MKTCSKCGLVKNELTDFYRAEGAKNGISARCKVCHNGANKAWAKEHPGYHLRATRKNRINHPERAMFNGVKARAKQKGIEFNLTVEDIVIPERCPLLGWPLKTGARMDERSDSPSLDRKDPSRGYVKGNVWVISFQANAIKRDATLAQLKMLVENLSKVEGIV